MHGNICILVLISASLVGSQTTGKTNETNNSKDIVSSSSNSTNGSVEDLITKAESWFRSDSDLEGYDIYHQDLDRANETTKYVNKKFPKLVYQRNHLDLMQKIVILEQGQHGLKDKQTYIVFRQTFSHPKHYTGHLVYIRKFRGQVSVEWDVLRSAVEPQEIFAAAFTPHSFGLDSIIRDANSTNQETAKETKPGLRRKRSTDSLQFKRFSLDEMEPRDTLNDIANLDSLATREQRGTLDNSTDTVKKEETENATEQPTQTQETERATEQPIQETATTKDHETKDTTTKTPQTEEKSSTQPIIMSKRPLIIPSKIFDDSDETSASVELSIEDEPVPKVIRGDGQRSNQKVLYYKGKPFVGKMQGRMMGRYLQPLGSFFGGIDLNNTVPEKRVLSKEDFMDDDDNDNSTATSGMIIEFDSKTKHPLFEDRSSPFTGILNCEYENVTLPSGDYFKLKSDMKTQFVGFLLKTLRGQCLSKIRENTLSLFLEELVSLGKNMKVNLHTINSIYKKKTLSSSQWDKVISAIYFTIYTDAYKHHAQLMDDDGGMYSKSPDAIKISLSVRTLTTMIIRGVEIIHDMETHAVKISKSLITTLNERYLHSLKEASLLKSECSDCFEEEDTNYQDRIQIRALKEFVIFGIEDTYGKKGSEMSKAFVEFYEKRLPALTGNKS